MIKFYKSQSEFFGLALICFIKLQGRFWSLIGEKYD